MDTTTDTANLDKAMTWNDPTTADLALVEVMQWRGTRDALLRRALVGSRADRKALIARMEDFTVRHQPEALRSPQALGSMIATMAALLWADGDESHAEAWLSMVPEGHKMGDLLRRLLASGRPAELWIRNMVENVTEEQCLAFAGQERTRFLRDCAA